MNELNAKLTAQGLIIEALLTAVVRAKLLDPKELAQQLDEFVRSPKAPWVEAEEVKLVAEEVSAWADMIADLSID